MSMVHAHAGQSTLLSDKDSVDFSWTKFFKHHFPDNTAAYVASFTRTTIRAAELMLSRGGSPNARGIANLLRSRIGPQVLDFIVGDTNWRAEERRRLEILALEQELENLKLKRRELAADLRQ